MDIFQLNWFLGTLAIELWASALLVAWGPELLGHWRRQRAYARVRSTVRR